MCVKSCDASRNDGTPELIKEYMVMAVMVVLMLILILMLVVMVDGDVGY